jgi:hypothetical protein
VIVPDTLIALQRSDLQYAMLSLDRDMRGNEDREVRITRHKTSGHGPVSTKDAAA